MWGERARNREALVTEERQRICGGYWDLSAQQRTNVRGSLAQHPEKYTMPAPRNTLTGQFLTAWLSTAFCAHSERHSGDAADNDERVGSFLIGHGQRMLSNVVATWVLAENERGRRAVRPELRPASLELVSLAKLATEHGQFGLAH